ncbi:MAG: ATP-binding protein [Planctomycetota bacterium]
MTDSQWIWQCERVIASDTVAGRRVLDEIVERIAQHDWPKRDIFGIHLAVHEAVVNAIMHGNQLHAGKRVTVRCFLAPEMVRFEIADEGSGFDPKRVPDPTDADRLEHPGGRGVMLMREFMSRVEYNDRGNQVTLEKLRSTTCEDES